MWPVMSLSLARPLGMSLARLAPGRRLGQRRLLVKGTYINAHRLATPPDHFTKSQVVNVAHNTSVQLDAALHCLAVPEREEAAALELGAAEALESVRREVLVTALFGQAAEVDEDTRAVVRLPELGAAIALELASGRCQLDS